MSIQAIVAAWEAPIASPTQKAVLAVMGNYADQDNKCWPSMALIARMTSFSENTVRTALINLENAGWISRQMRTALNGRSTSSMYMLLHMRGAAAVIAHGGEGPTLGGGGSNSRGGRVQLSGGGGSNSRGVMLEPLLRTQRRTLRRKKGSKQTLAHFRRNATSQARACRRCAKGRGV